MVRRSRGVFFRFPIGTLLAIVGPNGRDRSTETPAGTALEVVYVGLEMVDCPPSSSSYGQRVSQTSAGDRVDASTGSSHDACCATVVAAFEHCRCATRSDAP